MKVLAQIAEIKSYGDKNMIDVIQALKNQGFMILYLICYTRLKSMDNLCL